MTARHYFFLGFLTWLNVLNFIDRSLLVVFANPIIRDLELTHFQFALLDGLLFTAVYGIAGLLFGVLADRLSRPKVMAASITLWSAAVAIGSVSRGFGLLAFSRLLLGFGQAGLTPAAMSMLSDVFPENRRGIVASIYYLGPPLGVATGLLLAAAFGESFGWRGVFIALAMVGLSMAIATLLLRDPPRHHLQNDKHSNMREHFRELWIVIKKSPALVATLLGTMLVMMPHGAIVLDQVWLVHERGYSETDAQWIAGLVMLGGGIAGALLGGWLSDRFENRAPGSGRLKFLSLACIAIVPITISFRLVAPGTPLFLMLMFLSILVLMLAVGPVTAAAQELVPVKIRGTAIAVIILCMTLLGYAPGAALSGAMSDILANRGVAQPVTWALVIGTLPAALAAIVFALGARFSSSRKSPKQADIRVESI